MHGAIFPLLVLYIDDPDGPMTTLQTGSTFNVSYYMSYPHKVSHITYQPVPHNY